MMRTQVARRFMTDRALHGVLERLLAHLGREAGQRAYLRAGRRSTFN